MKARHIRCDECDANGRAQTWRRGIEFAKWQVDKTIVEGFVFERQPLLTMDRRCNFATADGAQRAVAAQRAWPEDGRRKVEA